MKNSGEQHDKDSQGAGKVSGMVRNISSKSADKKKRG